MALGLGLPPPPPHAARPTLPQPLDSLVQPSLCTCPRDLETQECQFLDKEDWGPRRTSKEMSHLQNDCRRLWESLSTIQADNRALGEKLQNLPTLSYESLRKEANALQEEVKAVAEGAQAAQEDTQAVQEDAQAFPEDAQGVALFQVPGEPHCGP